MFRWVAVVATIAIAAMLAAPFEPALGVPDARRLLLVLLILPLVRSPLWLTNQRATTP